MFILHAVLLFPPFTHCTTLQYRRTLCGTLLLRPAVMSSQGWLVTGWTDDTNRVTPNTLFDKINTTYGFLTFQLLLSQIYIGTSFLKIIQHCINWHILLAT